MAENRSKPKAYQRPAELPDLPARPADAHKGSFGTCLLVGGSHGMMGALILAGRAATRSGVGLCRLAGPETMLPVLPAGVPEATSVALPEEQGAPSILALPTLLGVLDNVDAIGLGPGLSRQGTAGELVLSYLRRTTLPTVLDADALNALEGQPDYLDACAVPVVLTPHPGEAARLLGLPDAGAVQEDRPKAAAELARRSQAIVVLKGAGTIVQEPEGFEGSPPPRRFVNRTGNPGMATGGTGDVLTGIITALLAQGLPPYEAAVLGVHAHGLAGDLAVMERGSQAGIVAGDLVEALPEVWKLLGGS
ncbi:MAG: NAD(P)H-hydrate dehydratase [Planctomycetota bacterium]